MSAGSDLDPVPDRKDLLTREDYVDGVDLLLRSEEESHKATTTMLYNTN